MILPPIIAVLSAVLPFIVFFVSNKGPKPLVLPKQSPIVVGSGMRSASSGGGTAVLTTSPLASSPSSSSKRMSLLFSSPSSSSSPTSSSAAAAAAVAAAPSEPFHVAATAEVLGTTHNISTIPAEDLTGFRIIGSGASARVYRAVWRGTVVAVKQMHKAVDLMNASSGFQDLSAEIKLWSQLRHPHIVQFLGVTQDLWLVMEYMDRGSLRTLMKQRQLASTTRMRLMMQVALAMDYLHSRKVIHRDLNPNNVMCSGPFENLQGKVADFFPSYLSSLPLYCFSLPLFRSPISVSAASRRLSSRRGRWARPCMLPQRCS